MSVYLFGGRPERAIEAADRSQNSIPLSGGYRVAALAAVGRLDEARESWRDYVGYVAGRWHGTGPADESTVARWFLSAPPIGTARQRNDLRAWLGKAGAPVG
ncbi:hypothetical protein [Methylobrevis pamukkalensis]|uniref:Uncharacterized protein n=1 Tax=Methylobrevis pamukkalensis TaxID=1439726 RepID=A0A1E3H3D9_9HYPH|nr:hypothetical protein [Methylobrevis pamukkalensis]ODN70820.1 hypothetical protein A6302_01867 [Methylobrevis pamukkalensis]